MAPRRCLAANTMRSVDGQTRGLARWLQSVVRALCGWEGDHVSFPKRCCSPEECELATHQGRLQNDLLPDRGDRAR